MLRVNRKPILATLLGVASYLLFLEIGRAVLASQLPSTSNATSLPGILTLLSIPVVLLVTLLVTVALGPLDRSSPRNYLRESLVALSCLLFVSIAHGILLLRVGADRPPVFPTTLFFVLSSFPYLGLYLFGSRISPPAASAAVSLILYFAACSNFLWTNSWVEAASEEKRPDRIEWILLSNPILVASGGLLEEDLLRRSWTYEHSTIGSFYRFEYPDRHRATLDYTLLGTLLWALGLGLSFFFPRRTHPKVLDLAARSRS